MRNLSFLLFVCIVTMLTGCPKSTPKQPEVFNKFNGKNNQILEKFDNQLAKYDCLMSGRNWSENSASSTNQQKLAKLEAEEMQITERLQSLPTEINTIQQNYLTQENNLSDDRDELEKSLLIAKRREALTNQILAYRQDKINLEAQLQRTPQRQTKLRNRLQQQINMLQQFVNELEIRLATEPPSEESVEVIELTLRQLQNRQDRSKTIADTQIKQKENERDLLNNKLKLNAQEQQNTIAILNQTRFSSQPDTKDSAGQKVIAGCINGGNGQPTDQQKILARTVRDNVIYELIRLTDYQYFQFENDLYVKRASGSVLADIIDFGGNLAGTITNGERAKTIINASLIAFRGGRKSASLNYFQEQTADVLITKMQTSRNRVLTEILTQVRDKDVDRYPLEAALGDAIKYFYAGTLPRALQELKKDASVAAQVAEEDVRILKDVKVSTPATQQDRDSAVNARDVLEELSIKSTVPENEKPTATSTAALAKLLSIAEKIKSDSTIKTEMENDEVLKDLLDKLEKNTDNGPLLAQTIQDIRKRGFKVLKKETLEKLDKIIIEANKN